MHTAYGGSCWLLHAACLLSGLIADTVDHGMHVLIIAPAPRKPAKVWRCCAVICMIYHSSDVALHTGGISRAPTQLTSKLGYLSVVCQAADSEPCPVSTASCSICRCPSSVLGHFKSNQKEVPSDCPWELLGAMRCSQHHACICVEVALLSLQIFCRCGSQFIFGGGASCGMELLCLLYTCAQLYRCSYT